VKSIFHGKEVLLKQMLITLLILGDKHIDTKVKEVEKGKPSALFNEKFQMKTALEYDNTN
jgi:hypothetical protein